MKKNNIIKLIVVSFLGIALGCNLNIGNTTLNKVNKNTGEERNTFSTQATDVALKPEPNEVPGRSDITSALSTKASVTFRAEDIGRNKAIQMVDMSLYCGADRLREGISPSSVSHGIDIAGMYGSTKSELDMKNKRIKVTFLPWIGCYAPSNYNVVNGSTTVKNSLSTEIQIIRKYSGYNTDLQYIPTESFFYHVRDDKYYHFHYDNNDFSSNRVNPIDNGANIRFSLDGNNLIHFSGEIEMKDNSCYPEYAGTEYNGKNCQYSEYGVSTFDLKIKRGSILAGVEAEDRDAKIGKIYGTKTGDKVKINVVAFANDNWRVVIKGKDENGQSRSYMEDGVGTKSLTWNGKTNDALTETDNVFFPSGEYDIKLERPSDEIAAVNGKVTIDNDPPEIKITNMSGNTIEGTITDKTGIDVASIPTSVQDGDKTISIVVKPKNDKEVNFTGIISNFDAERLNDELERDLLESSVGGTMEDNVKDVFGNIAPNLKTEFSADKEIKDSEGNTFSTQKFELKASPKKINLKKSKLKQAEKKGNTKPKTKEEQEKEDKEKKEEVTADYSAEVNINDGNPQKNYALEIGKGNVHLNFYSLVLFPKTLVNDNSFSTNQITLSEQKLFIRKADRVKLGKSNFSSIKIAENKNITLQYTTIGKSINVIFPQAIWYGSIRSKDQLRSKSIEDSKNGQLFGPPFAEEGDYEVVLIIKGLKLNGKFLRGYGSGKDVEEDIGKFHVYNEHEGYNEPFKNRFNKPLDNVIKISDERKFHIRKRHDANFLTGFQFIRVYELKNSSTILDAKDKKPEGLIELSGAKKKGIYSFIPGITDENYAKGSTFDIDHNIFLKYAESIANMRNINDSFSVTPKLDKIEGIRDGFKIRVSFNKSNYSILSAFPETEPTEEPRLRNYYLSKDIDKIVNMYNNSYSFSLGKISDKELSNNFTYQFREMGKLIKDKKIVKTTPVIVEKYYFLSDTKNDTKSQSIFWLRDNFYLEKK